jgi:aspartyl-tRNA(Asn)/glutamyl-tRNA(Gln) amidotransferase subunit A
MFHRAGRLSEMGTLIHRGEVARTTASVLTRLDRAGAIDVGRLNMVEFALGVTGHNAHTGTPRNAWNPAHITGGSTSGGATAVAARLVPATLGSDTGGSIRVPASLCGIVGIKPTYGRVSRAGAMPLSFSLDHVGPLCRSSEDAALMMEVIAGADPKDRTTSGRPVPRYRDYLGGGLKGLRVLLPRDCFEAPVEAEVERAWQAAVAVLRDLGAEIIEGPHPAFEPLNALRRLLTVVEIATLHSDLVAQRAQDYNATTIARMVMGYAVPATDYLRALAARGPLTQRYCRDVFARADIVALPTAPIRTPTIAESDSGGDLRYVEISNRMGALIAPFNYLGLPAVSTPMGFDATGMPLGLQLVSRPFDEGPLLAVSHAFEQATGWIRKAPPGVAAD